MMNSEDTISTQIIKPSCPTPNHLKTKEISFLDQLGPPSYIPLIFFYQHNISKPNFNPTSISESLKQSLSQILTHYYPLAGTLHKNSFIDCDDSGMEFTEARVDSPLWHFTDDSNTEELRRLIPLVVSAHTLTNFVKVKLTFFECGGFSVGFCFSHKIGDYASYVGFISAWAAACRGETLASPPLFDLAHYFPPRDSAPDYFSEEKDKVVVKRLVFDNELLGKIKAQSVCDQVKNPTRVEALSSFIWKMFIDATKEKRSPDKSSFAAFHAVNLRPRAVPPIPDETFGNCYVGKFAFTNNGEIGDLVASLRAAIRSVDDNYIKNVVSRDAYLTVLDEANRSFADGTTDLCYFSSWWRFPVYDVNFGWGKPCWVSTVAQPYKNLVILMGTPTGNGIEAWIHMPRDFCDIIETCYKKLVTSLKLVIKNL